MGHLFGFFLGRNAGVCTYDALDDALEEDGLSLVVWVLHRIALCGEQSRDQAAIRREIERRPAVVGADP